MKNTFQIGDERIGANGETLRLCVTQTGKQQWRTVGADGNPIKRGRKGGVPVLSEMTLYSILQHVGGKKFATALKAAAKDPEPFGTKIKVSSAWAGEAKEPVKEPALKEGVEKPSKKVRVKKEVAVESV